MNRNQGLAPGSDPEAVAASADQISGFTICGADHVFHEAKAVFNGKADRVIVGSPKVREPVAVRYAWATFALANLYNQAGLPAHPFRTDDFPMPRLEAGKQPKNRELEDG